MEFRNGTRVGIKLWKSVVHKLSGSRGVEHTHNAFKNTNTGARTQQMYIYIYRRLSNVYSYRRHSNLPPATMPSRKQRRLRQHLTALPGGSSGWKSVSALDLEPVPMSRSRLRLPKKHTCSIMCAMPCSSGSWRKTT